MDSIPGLGRSPGKGNGNPFQYSCLENPMDRGGWQVIVHGVTRAGHDLVTKPSPLQWFPNCLQSFMVIHLPQINILIILMFKAFTGFPSH